MDVTKRSIPRSILIFGAAGHIGQPLAEFLTQEAPNIQLSLVARSPENQKMLQHKFPHARVLAADYEDPSSLAAAVKGIEGVFVISSSGMLETSAMKNLTNFLKQDGSAVQVIRLLGIFPEFNPHRVPFLDPRDVAEVAARLFLSDNAKHIGELHTMNNGHDCLNFEEVAVILSEELGEPIAFDGSYEGFMEFWGPRMGKKAERLWNFFEFEQANEEQWALNKFVERILGRKPIAVRSWIVEHKHGLLNAEHLASWGQ